MSQKVQIYRNTNELSKTFGKYYVRAVYDEKFITTAELADYIQTQCTVKRSDCKAVLDELGAAFKHYFELGQKIRLDNIGIFKVGITSAPSDSLAGCGASSVKKSRVLFQPETSAIATGETVSVKRARLGRTRWAAASTMTAAPAAAPAAVLAAATTSPVPKWSDAGSPLCFLRLSLFAYNYISLQHNH